MYRDRIFFFFFFFCMACASHVKLLPSRRKFCVHHTTMHQFTVSRHAKVHACLAVTCHLHFWQNDRDLLRATAVTREWKGYRNKSQHRKHTPSVAFRHLPPNSARFGYATERALFISAQLSTDSVSALRKVWVLIRLWKQPSAKAPT